jgi:threonine dehydrogenase-like Zn-dependent dehydrogenase
MWAYRLVAPRKFEYCCTEELTGRHLRPREILVSPLAGAVCGSDLPVFKGQDSLARPDGTPGASMIPGNSMHEIVGEVLASAHEDWAAGDRVVGWATSHRGIAERVITSGDAVVRCPGSLKPEVAVMLQSLACVLDSVARGPTLNSVDRATVLGLGPIGLLFSHVLKAGGVSSVEGVDLINRESVSKYFGLDEVVQSSSDRWAKAAQNQARSGLVIEAIGHNTATLSHAIFGCAERGHVNYFGISDVSEYPLPMDRMIRKNLTLSAGHVVDKSQALRKAVDYLNSFPELAETYVSHTFKVSKVTEAYEFACQPIPERIKVSISFD